MGEQLTATERRVLDRLQRGFPLEAAPYCRLGEELGLSAEEAFTVVSALCRRGVIRRLGPVFDAQALGYVSTLLGVETAPEALEEVAARVSEFPEVTHNYLRDHQLNVWCTVLAAGKERLREVVRSVEALGGVRRVVELPVRRRYKLRLHFPLESEEDVDDAG
jgi:DNA-binding Lrp family transcriptional regulator